MRLLDHLARHPVRAVDLAQPLWPGMPHSPTHPGFASVLTSGHDGPPRDDGMTGAHETITLGTHVGTHVDAACHVAVRRAVLVDVPGRRGVDRLDPGEAVTVEDLARGEAPIGAGDAVLVRTGWAQLWDRPELYVGTATGVPGLDEAAGAWLAERGVALVGADTIALEQIRPETGHRRLPVHRVLLAEAGINLVEVMDLEAVAGQREFALVCAPLRILGATGGPVRPVALLDAPSMTQEMTSR